MALRGLSIQVKLPLLIGAVLVAVTGIYSWAAYQTMQRSASTTIMVRLRTVADQYAQALTTQRDQLVAAVQSIAASPAVRAYAVHTGPELPGAGECPARLGRRPVRRERRERRLDRLEPARRGAAGGRRSRRQRAAL